MKSDQSKKMKEERTAEEWVTFAKEYGEKCQAVQHDPKLSLDQKLEKQNKLSKEAAKVIKDDPFLKSEEKKLMVESIESYMDEWVKIHDLLKDNSEKISK